MRKISVKNILTNRTKQRVYLLILLLKTTVIPMVSDRLTLYPKGFDK